MSDSQVLRGEARKGVQKLVARMGGSTALQNTAGNIADKAITAGTGALMKNKGKILGKVRKLVGFQKGGMIVLHATPAKRTPRRRARKSRK